MHSLDDNYVFSMFIIQYKVFSVLWFINSQNRDDLETP